jgi:hypothetical protein
LIRKEVKMLKKALFLVAVVAMLGGVANAADKEFKSAGFASKIIYTPIETGCEIPVKMDINYYVKIVNCSGLSIKMIQKSGSIDDYEGTTSMTVVSNFNVELSGEFVTNGNVSFGSVGASVTPAQNPKGTNTVTVKAWGNDADLAGVDVKENLQVGVVKIKVAPY